MPTIAPSFNPPYDILETVLNLARVKVNDAIATIGGDIYTDLQPFSQVIANGAWRELQEYIANLGFTRFKQEIILYNLPVVTNRDPATQTYLNWAGYYDGTGYNVPPKAPTLPQDMILPLKLAERSSNTQNTFTPMHQALDGLPDTQKLPANIFWEWRNDAIYMPGASIVTDIRLRYASYLPDFITTGTLNWTQQPVPIMRCLESFACYIAAAIAGPRADLDAQSFIQKAEKAADKIFNREVQQKSRTTATRRPYGRRYRGTHY